MSSNNKEGNLVWIDLEMTGLDPDKDRIIEIATIVTDAHLNVLAEGPVFAIHQKDMVLNGMDEWNTRQHGGSGLTERVRRSKIDEAAAECGWQGHIGCEYRPSRGAVAGATSAGLGWLLDASVT